MVQAIRERWVVVVLLGILLTVGLVGDRPPPVITDFTARSAGEMTVPYTAAMSPLPAIHADSWGPVTTPTPVPSPRPVRGPNRREAPTRHVPPAPVTGHPQQIAATMLADRGWAGHWGALNALVSAESGWNPRAVNRRSGACGLFQRLPCRGMHLQPVEVQVENGLSYIAGRYGTPSGAWAAFKRKGWY